ncbi:hypothetical protein [Oxynema aestuarii]|nr:hypothetical protein [Oxynema aestuarii]
MTIRSSSGGLAGSAPVARSQPDAGGGSPDFKKGAAMVAILQA